MDKQNPACYECPKGRNSLHTWRMVLNQGAICLNCGLRLTEEQAMDLGFSVPLPRR